MYIVTVYKKQYTPFTHPGIFSTHAYTSNTMLHMYSTCYYCLQLLITTHCMYTWLLTVQWTIVIITSIKHTIHVLLGVNDVCSPYGWHGFCCDQCVVVKNNKHFEVFLQVIRQTFNTAHVDTESTRTSTSCELTTQIHLIWYFVIIGLIIILCLTNRR